MANTPLQRVRCTLGMNQATNGMGNSCSYCSLFFPTLHPSALCQQCSRGLLVLLDGAFLGQQHGVIPYPNPKKSSSQSGLPSTTIATVSFVGMVNVIYAVMHINSLLWRVHLAWDQLGGTHPVFASHGTCRRTHLAVH
jgi:hypothetical protein